MLLLILQVLVAVLVGLSLLGLVLGLFVESVTMVIHAAVDFLLVASFHISCLLLDLLLCLTSLELFLLHLTDKVLLLFLILLHESGLLLLTVTILCFDRLLQVADLLL